MQIESSLSVALHGHGSEVPWTPKWNLLSDGTWEWATEPLPPHRSVRITFRPGIAIDACSLHHGALPRMVGRTITRANEDWRDGWHSPLTGDVHFEEPIGAPGFGIYPPLVILPDAGPGYILGPVTELRSRCHWSWHASEDGELVVQAELIPWGIEGEHCRAPILSEAFCVQQLPAGCALSPQVFERFNQRLQFHLGQTAAQANPDPGLTWATWNDGTFRDIDSKRILAMCDFAVRELPQVRWIQIDDGWARPSATPTTEDGTLAMSDFGALYRPERLDGDPRFPGGLGQLASNIRSRGLRPMLWLTPAVAEGSLLYQEHPEMFLQEARLSWMPEMRFLDFSIPATRKFVESALDLVFNEWGYEGTKLDFWTMTFEETNVHLANHERTAIEWMGWFLDQVRQRIPKDGLILHCIGLPFGGPFRAKWCDHFRFYADSEGSAGVPAMAREQALWAAVLLGLYQVQQFWIPNGDGFGLFDHIKLPENEHRRWAAFMLASGTTTELCGWLHQKDDLAAVDRVKRVAKLTRFGGKIELPGYDFAAASPEPPSTWVQTSKDGQVIVSLLNWTDEAIRLEIPVGGSFREIFLDEPALGGEFVEIPARDGRAYVKESNR